VRAVEKESLKRGSEQGGGHECVERSRELTSVCGPAGRAPGSRSSSRDLSPFSVLPLSHELSRVSSSRLWPQEVSIVYPHNRRRPYSSHGPASSLFAAPLRCASLPGFRGCNDPSVDTMIFPWRWAHALSHFREVYTIAHSVCSASRGRAPN